MLEVKDLYAGYGGDDVIRNICFSVKARESLCILGPNGCGKSTLLKSLARIINCRGQVSLDGRELATIPRKALAQKIAMLGQNTQVFFPYTVRETVSMGRYAYSQGFMKNLSAQDRAIIDDIITKLDIEDIREHMIDELSGGQLQRVFLARTLAQTPDVILLDEPTNHLDLKYQIELLQYLKNWVKENNTIFVSVFHDLNLARHFGDTALLIDKGIIAAYGPIEETLIHEKLQEVYGIDIRAFMLESLEKWK
jgi:iron complex transport system ATP-binding protein